MTKNSRHQTDLKRSMNASLSSDLYISKYYVIDISSVYTLKYNLTTTLL